MSAPSGPMVDNGWTNQNGTGDLEQGTGPVGLGPVSSVNTHTGDVVLAAADVSAVPQPDPVLVNVAHLASDANAAAIVVVVNELIDALVTLGVMAAPAS